MEVSALLRRAYLGLVEPFALLGLLVAAAMRLNLWAVLYACAAVTLRWSSRYITRGSRYTTCRWGGVRALLAASIALQYVTTLAFPPSVWPDDDGRPWVHWGATWPLVRGECQRFGHPPTSASGFICYMALDGGLPTWWLTYDFIALLMCILPSAAPAMAILDEAVRPSEVSTETSPVQKRGAVIFSLLALLRAMPVASTTLYIHPAYK